MVKNMAKEDILAKAREDAVNIIEATGAVSYTHLTLPTIYSV